MKKIFDDISYKCSEITTKAYSTSFSLGILMLNKRLRGPIYGIYGFVRFADEIVDSFNDYNNKLLFNKFKEDTYLAIQDKISLNPILNNFQHIVHKYKIENNLIDSFLTSMEMDLSEKKYDEKELKKYILGSAEVVGLMCLKIFLNGDEPKYKKLKPYAMNLGSAFQKINFLRDLNHDYEKLGRIYFPNINLTKFNNQEKNNIENEIEIEFKEGLKGIELLPKSAKHGVYLSYLYYYKLFKKIKKIPAKNILKKRIRISNLYKLILFILCVVKLLFRRI